MCCHPKLSRNSSIPLSLKMVGGFGVREIARALLADEPTIAQRLVRAKRQIRDEAISLELPRDRELPSRLDSVLETIYLIFNEGYAASSGDDLVRVDLCREAIRLGRLVANSSLSMPKCHALIALLAFQAARFPARVNADGELVLLADQDRTLWDRGLIALAFHHFSQSAEGEEISEYHLQAAIAAIHARLDGTATDWKSILELYDQLVAINPSPIVRLNRAVALGKVLGAQPALEETAALECDSRLKNYYLLHAVRGKFHMEIGEKARAAACFRAALGCPCSEPEKRLLMRRLEECA
jgi:RNA polymerase sigma-70 factor (ECF subfamily)